MIVLQILGGLVSVGPAIQDAIMELFSTFVVGYTVLFHIRLYNFNVVFVLFPAVVCLLIGHFLAQWNSASNTLRTLRSSPHKAPAKQKLNKPWKKKLYPGDVGWIEDLERGTRARSPSVGCGAGERSTSDRMIPMPGVDNMYRGMHVVDKLQAKQEKSFQKSVANAREGSKTSPSPSAPSQPKFWEDDVDTDESSQSSSTCSSTSSDSSESSESSDSSDSSEHTTFQAAKSKALKLIPTETLPAAARHVDVRPSEPTSAPAIVEPLEIVTDRMQRMAEQKLQQALAQPVKSAPAPAATTVPAQELLMQHLREQMAQMRELLRQKQMSKLDAWVGMQGVEPAPMHAPGQSVTAPAMKAACAGSGVSVDTNTITTDMGDGNPSLGLSSSAHLASTADRIAKLMELKIRAKLARKKQS